MRLTIHHATTYTYDPPADRCALRLRLYPPVFDSQKVLDWKVSVNGQAIRPLMTTATGDRELVWTVAGSTPEVAIMAEGEVEVRDTAGVVRGLKDTVRPGVYLRTTPLTQPDKRIEALGAGIAPGKPLERMHALFNAVADAVAYRPATTTSSTTAAQALKAGQGVCQDHAHVFISASRTMGVPARYVVGYLLASDANLTETHAWAEAWVQDIGWVGFDAANRLCPTDRYVRLGCGLDAADAAPIRGNVSGMHQERLSASVDISPAEVQNQVQNQEGQSQQ
ncbi:MAG: transglutaminase family protein [Hyphomonadaceae bacterium]